MGRQVRFLLADDEIALLEEHLLHVGAAFIPARSTTPDLLPQSTLATPPEMLGLTPDIVRIGDIPTARREYQPTPWAEPPAPGYWKLDMSRTPAIDYMRGTASDPQRYGRLHFMTTKPRDGKTVPMDPDFVAWADAILNWVRRTFRYDRSHQLYAGPPKRRQ